MYAVIETGGKQYRVEVGTELEVELLDLEPGKTVTLDRVLLVADGGDASIGRPLVADATVDAEVLRQDRGDKVVVFKYGPKTRRRVKKGHRQDLTVLRITDVKLGSRSAAAERKKADADAKTERERLQEAAAKQAAEDAALAEKLAVGKPAAKPAPKRASTAKPSSTAKAAPKAAAGRSGTSKASASSSSRAKPAAKADATEKKPAPKRRTTKKDE
jgi:large subunit ribosomal protein L21